MDIYDVGILCIVGTFLGLFLGQSKKEYTMLLQIAICIILFFVLFTSIKSLKHLLEDLFDRFPLPKTYLQVLFKMLGITYIAEVTADLCKDAGNTTVAKQIQMFAKISLLMLSIPILYGFLELLEAFL